MRRSIMFAVVGAAFFLLEPCCFAHAALAEEPRVSINVIDAKVSEVLAALGRLGRVNIVADDLDAGKITVRFEGVKLSEALSLIAKAKGLDYQQSGDVVVICKKGALAANFGRLHYFKLRFADPMEAALAASLSIDGKRKEEKIKNFAAEDILSTAKSEKVDYNISERLQVDRAVNALIFRGSDAEAERIRALLDVIDVAYPQVSLKAEVVAIDKNRTKELGIRWDWSDQQGEPGVIAFGKNAEKSPFGVIYKAKVAALVAKNEAVVLASPNITTMNGREAVINIGGEVPVPTVSVTNSTTETSVEYRESGIILRYIPQINEDGFITAEVHTEVSSPVYVPEVNAYRFNKRSADTKIRLKNGETMVIGGLIGSEEIRAVSKVPFLADLPIFGRFFRHVEKNKNESEIIIFLTAHIVE